MSNRETVRYAMDTLQTCGESSWTMNTTAVERVAPRTRMIEVRLSKRFGMSHVSLMWFGRCAFKVSVRSMPFRIARAVDSVDQKGTV